MQHGCDLDGFGDVSSLSSLLLGGVWVPLYEAEHGVCDETFNPRQSLFAPLGEIHPALAGPPRQECLQMYGKQ